MVQIVNAGDQGTFGLRINEENRADVEAVSRPIDQHINEKYEKMFSLPFDAVDPVGADDYFFYIKNTGTKSLHIESIAVRSTVVGTVEVHAVTGTVVFAAEAAVTPVNRTVGSSNSITAVTSADTNATGLTNAGILEYIRLDTANAEHHLDMSSHIIIPPGQSIALLWDTATGILSGLISIYEDQGVT